jgi:hypothetical protein
MRQKLSLVMTLAAWLIATGSHWDLVQTFAWGKMFATYSQSMSYADAARLTFTPGNFCGVCEFVADASQAGDDDSMPPPTSPREIQLALVQITPVVVPRMDSHRWSLSDLELPLIAGSSPPTPPPRA